MRQKIPILYHHSAECRNSVPPRRAHESPIFRKMYEKISHGEGHVILNATCDDWMDSARCVPAVQSCGDCIFRHKNKIRCSCTRKNVCHARAAPHTHAYVQSCRLNSSPCKWTLRGCHTRIVNCSVESWSLLMPSVTIVCFCVRALAQVLFTSCLIFLQVVSMPILKQRV